MYYRKPKDNNDNKKVMSHINNQVTLLRSHIKEKDDGIIEDNNKFFTLIQNSVSNNNKLINDLKLNSGKCSIYQFKDFNYYTLSQKKYTLSANTEITFKKYSFEFHSSALIKLHFTMYWKLNEKSYESMGRIHLVVTLIKNNNVKKIKKIYSNQAGDNHLNDISIYSDIFFLDNNDIGTEDKIINYELYLSYKNISGSYIVVDDIDSSFSIEKFFIDRSLM